MTPFDRAVTATSVILICAVIAGLVGRRRLAACVCFTLYLLAVASSEAVIALWPDRFWRRSFWIFKESVHNLLKLGIALELMVRIFRHFPSAYAAVRRGVFVVVAGLAVVVWYALAAGTDYFAVVGRLYPHVNDGTVWLLVCVGAFCLWYHLPLDSVHKAILIGLVPYLLVYSVVQRAVVALGWERAEVFDRSAPIAYICLLSFWVYVAWRKEPGDAGTRVRLMMDRQG